MIFRPSPVHVRSMSAEACHGLQINDGDAVPRTGKFIFSKRPGQVCKRCGELLTTPPASKVSLSCMQRVIVSLNGETRVRPDILELRQLGKRRVNPHYMESYRCSLHLLLHFTGLCNKPRPLLSTLGVMAICAARSTVMQNQSSFVALRAFARAAHWCTI